jgi:MFS family permease
MCAESSPPSVACETMAEIHPIRRFWPIFFVEACLRIAIAGLMLNTVGLSNVIWPGDRFHSLEFGFIISAKLTTVSVVGVLIGVLADRYSRKKLLLLALAIMAAGKIFNVFATQPWMFVDFLLCYIVVGAGEGGIAPIVFSIANDDCHLSHRSRFFGTLEGVRQVSVIVGMFISAFLIDADLWHAYFMSMGFLLVAAFIVAGLFLHEPKRAKEAHESLKRVLALTSAHYSYQLTTETIKQTIFSRTNVLAFVEGLFTWIMFSVAIYLIYPWIQDVHGVSAVSTSAIMLVFGMPGVIIGAIGFSRLSDKLAKKSIKFRIYMIIFSIVTLFAVVIGMFLLPIPDVDPALSNDIRVLYIFPVFIAFGVLVFFLRAVLGIYHINQNPVLQAINLPEAQGFISSANQFLENMGYGIGPLIAGIFLTLNGNNYPMTALISLFIGLPSVFMWLFAARWVDGDVARINSILATRAGEIAHEDESGGEDSHGE